MGLGKYHFELLGSRNATRNSADIALLMISGGVEVVSSHEKTHLGRICGIAYLNAYRYKTFSFGLVGKGCPTVVTGHEVGHMFGALHNKEISSGADQGFEYGYLIPGGYASIMA